MDSAGVHVSGKGGGGCPHDLAGEEITSPSGPPSCPASLLAHAGLSSLPSLAISIISTFRADLLCPLPSGLYPEGFITSGLGPDDYSLLLALRVSTQIIQRAC